MLSNRVHTPNIRDNTGVDVAATSKTQIACLNVLMTLDNLSIWADLDESCPNCQWYPHEQYKHLGRIGVLFPGPSRHWLETVVGYEHRKLCSSTLASWISRRGPMGSWSGRVGGAQRSSRRGSHLRGKLAISEPMRTVATLSFACNDMEGFRCH